MLLKPIQQRRVEYVVVIVVFLVFTIKHTFAISTYPVSNENFSTLSIGTTANQFIVGYKKGVSNVPATFYFTIRSNKFQSQVFEFKNVRDSCLSRFPNFRVFLKISTVRNQTNSKYARSNHILNEDKEILFNQLTHAFFKLTNLNQS